MSYERKGGLWVPERALVHPNYQDLWDDMIDIWPMWSGGNRLVGVSGEVMTVISGPPEWLDTPYGISASRTPGGNNWYAERSIENQGPVFTFVFFVENLFNGYTQKLAVHNTAPSTNDGYRITQRSDDLLAFTLGGVADYTFSGLNTLVAGNFYVIAITSTGDGGTATAHVWNKTTGVYDTDSVSIGTMAGTPDRVRFRAEYNGGSIYYGGNIATYWWSKVLPFAKLSQVASNPFGTFTYARRISVVVPAAVEEEAEEITGAITEGAEAGDTFAAVGTFGESVTEGVDAGDDWAGLLDLAGAIAEGVAAGETLTAALQMAGAVSAGATAGETLEMAYTVITAITEGALAGDQYASAATFLGAITEGAAAGDTLAGQLLMALAWSEGAEAGDAWVSTLAVLEEGVSEGIVSGDAYTSILTHAAAYSEGAVAGEAVAAIMAMGAAITEGIEAGDNFAGQFPGIEVDVAEGATAGDVMAHAYATHPAFSDGSVASDVYTAIHDMLGAVAEGALAGDLFVSSVGILAETWDEGALAGDAYAAGLSYVLGWAEGATVGDAWSATVINYLAGLKIIPLIMPLVDEADIDLPLVDTAGIDLPLTDTASILLPLTG